MTQILIQKKKSYEKEKYKKEKKIKKRRKKYFSINNI